MCRWPLGSCTWRRSSTGISRYVLAWRLSNTLDGSFCLEMLEEALVAGSAGGVQHRPGRAVHGPGVDGAAGVGGGSGEHGRQGSVPGQRVRGAAVADGEVRGHLPVAATRRCRSCSRGWVGTSRIYNEERLHQSLDYRTPAAVYQQGRTARIVRRGKKAFFFAPHSLSPGEGSAVRKRMPGDKRTVGVDVRERSSPRYCS